jgi:CIC family chloride channel protein
MNVVRTAWRALVGHATHVVLAAAVVGAVTGLAVALFERVTVDVVLDGVLDLPLWALALAPGAGLALTAVALRAVGGGVSPATSDEYLRAFHEPGYELGLRPLAGRLVAALATLGLGGAMGLEGPSLYLGATTGQQTQHRLRRLFRGAQGNVLLVAGAAAGVAAIFKAPATGAVFALESPYRDDLARRMLLPALVAAACGYLTFVAVNGTARLFPVAGDPAFDFRDLVGAVALGAGAGLGARLFAWALRRAKDWSPAGGVLARIVVAGVVLAGLFAVVQWAAGESLTIGPGYDVIDWALDPSHATWLVVLVLVARCFATVATVGGGGTGGLFIPLVVAGALSGRAAFGVLHPHDPGLFVVIGVASFLGAGYRVPLAAVIFVAETTGRPGFVVPGLLAAVAAELVMGRSSVTTFQRAAAP